jgi:hypothetical protein
MPSYRAAGEKALVEEVPMQKQMPYRARHQPVSLK